MSTRLLAAVLALCLPAMTAAQSIQLQGFSLDLGETRYSLDADFRPELTPPALEALKNGVSLSFIVEFELTRPRWYWFDEKVASERLELRLAYLPLTQQFQLSSGTLHQNFATLAEALSALGAVHGWPVLDRDRVDNGRQYVASVRMRLDPTQLPTLFRMSAVTNRDWTLVSDWKRIPFTPLAPVQEAR